MRIIFGETVSQEALKTILRKWEGLCVYDLGKGGHATSTQLVEGYFTHEEEISELMFLVLSKYGKMQGTGFIESLLKLSKCLRVGSASFPRAQST